MSAIFDCTRNEHEMNVIEWRYLTVQTMSAIDWRYLTVQTMRAIERSDLTVQAGELT